MSNGFYNPEMRPNVVRMIDGHRERIANLEWKRKRAEGILRECDEELADENAKLTEWTECLAIIDGEASE